MVLGTATKQSNFTEDGKITKRKRKNKTNHGENFIAPDGGWAWLVCFAAGCSNLVAFPVLQQFGLLFRERFTTLGLTNTQITTVINVNSALSACTGLLNGPMFRRFSYRQIGLTGATLMTTGLLLTYFANSFIAYIFTYSVFYGIGIGISISSNSLALNTYFKEKRRMATGFSWTITSFGPIVMPYIINGLLDEYDVQGALLLLCGIVMHTYPCALIYQPVSWHVKKQSIKNNDNIESAEIDYKCTFCRLGQRRNTGIFSSQYLCNNDDIETPGYEITDPGTPMMSRANDGWYSKTLEQYGSKLSLTSRKSVPFIRCMSVTKEPLTSMPLKESDEEKESLEGNHSKDNDNKNSDIQEKIAIENMENPLNTFNSKREILKRNISRASFSRKSIDPLWKCTCQEERELLKLKGVEQEEFIEIVENEKMKLTIFQKIAVFFDLDLLKDLTYVNLTAGLTLANFTELNFSVLTPFILNDFGYTKEQIVFAMSLLAGMDTGIRFIIPFIAERIGWENRTFFLFGILTLATGRILIAHFHSYLMLLIICIIIGTGKALRTIFMALVMPSYVPLERLPAASGLQLIIMGIFTFAMGPIVGLIRDATNYTITLHCLNVCTFVTAISWGLESMYHRLYKKEM